MRAVVVSAPGEVAVHERPDPAPGADDVVVAVHRVGLCGTDLHLVDGELPYDSLPVVPGHEFVGEVVAAGSAAHEHLVGRRVVIDPNLPCGRCSECRRGRSNLCLDYRALGVTEDGGAAEYVRVPVTSVYQVPDGVPESAAVLTEPLACAVHGFDGLPRRLGDRYLVYGAGTMGLLMALLATEVGSDAVHVVETNPARRALAGRFGLHAAATADAFDGDGRWDTVIDCTGVVDAIEDGLARVGRGGVFQCFGVADPDALVKVRPFDIYRGEISVVGSMAVLHSVDRALRLVSSWGERLAPLVTTSAGLDAYPAALRAFRAGEGIKHVVDPQAPAGLPDAARTHPQEEQ